MTLFTPSSWIRGLALLAGVWAGMMLLAAFSKLVIVIAVMGWSGYLWWTTDSRAVRGLALIMALGAGVWFLLKATPFWLIFLALTGVFMHLQGRQTRTSGNSLAG